MDEQEKELLGKGQGFKAYQAGRTLILEIDLDAKPVVSGSGKSMVIASTRGNKSFTVDGMEDEVVVGLNVYTKV